MITTSPRNRVLPLVTRLSLLSLLSLLPGTGCATDTDPPTAAASEGSSDATGTPGTSDGSTESTDPATTTTTATTTTATTTTTTTTNSTDSDTSSTGALPAGCGNPSPGPGTHKDRSVQVDGETREYDLFVPTGYDPATPTSLVLNFHGLLGNPGQQADFSQFNDTAEARGIVVAYPKGIGNSFNAGACCGTAESQNVNDILFARTLVSAVVGELCIDPRRVYVTGMSNGAHMAHTLACRAADVFAAAASVTGVLGLPPEDCQPTRPISMLDFHGTSDLIVSYNGAGPGYPPVVPMMEGWAARNGCVGEPVVTFERGDMVCETWNGCSGAVEVTLCTIDGGGHCWPGNESCTFGHSSTALHASEAIADMFAGQLLPE